MASVDTELGKKLWYAVYDEDDNEIIELSETDENGVIKQAFDEGVYNIKVKEEEDSINIILRIELTVELEEVVEPEPEPEIPEPEVENKEIEREFGDKSVEVQVNVESDKELFYSIIDEEGSIIKESTKLDDNKLIKAELEDGNYIVSIMNQGEDNAIKIINLKLKTKEEQKPEIPVTEMKLEKESKDEKVEIDTELGKKVWYAVYNSEEPDVKIRGIAPTDNKGIIVLDGEENLEEKTGTLDEGKYIIKIKNTQGGENIIKIINLEVVIKEEVEEVDTDLLRNLDKNQKRK